MTLPGTAAKAGKLPIPPGGVRGPPIATVWNLILISRSGPRPKSTTDPT